MRQRVILYIKGKQADIDASTFILLNYALTDMENPTNIRNSYSQKITLPCTSTNVEIFNSFGRLDRITDSGLYNVIAKEPFELMNQSGEKLMSGYIKLEGASAKGFEIVLYGGLGTLFNGLHTKTDGTALTLADLTYEVDDETYTPTRQFRMNDLPESWTYLSSGSYQDNIDALVQFAPFYEGFPEDFDSKKEYCSGITAKLDGSDSYIPYNGVGGNAIKEWENEHTMLEEQEIRNYLCRPMVNVKRLMKAIVDNANGLTGYDLIVDNSVTTMPDYDKMWFTLPMLKTEYRKYSTTTMTLKMLFEDTISPFEFLVSFAKLFGCVFVAGVDSVTMLTRQAFFSKYSASILDLTDRIDRSTIKVTPVVSESHYYTLMVPGVGEVAQLTREDDPNGIEYGGVRINTGYPFNENTKNLLEDTKLHTAAVTNRYSNYNLVAFFKPNAGNTAVAQYYDIFRASETSKVTLYKQSNHPNNRVEPKEFDYDTTINGCVAWMGSYLHPQKDWRSNIELMDADRKAEDGSYMFVKYTSMSTTASSAYYNPGAGITINVDQLKYRPTFYDATRISLNDGVDCWDKTQPATITQLPNFVPIYCTDLYTARWKNYLNDLYDVDSLRLTCKCDLSGLRVEDDLLAHFWYYDGAIWVINKVKNYSVTTDNLTEVELIKVKDTNNYTA